MSLCAHCPIRTSQPSVRQPVYSLHHCWPVLQISSACQSIQTSPRLLVYLPVLLAFSTECLSVVCLPDFRWSICLLKGKEIKLQMTFELLSLWCWYSSPMIRRSAAELLSKVSAHINADKRCQLCSE